MTDWPLPEGITGDPGLIRVFTGGAKEGEEDCPTLRAVKARPRLRSVHRTPYKPADFEPFALAAVMRKLDVLEFGRVRDDPARVRPAHPGLERYAEHALAQYLAAARSLDSEEELLPDPKYWVRQSKTTTDPHGNRTVYELRVWGRCYANRERTVCELRLLRFGSVRPGRRGRNERDPAEVSMAAYVAAHGGRAAGPTRWGDEHNVQGAVTPQRVRVVEIGCLDGSVRPLFDGTPDEARAAYQRLAAPRLRGTVDAVHRRPGPGCATCRLTATCPGLQRTPGILGITDSSRPRRTLSVTDLRRYANCPAQEHLRRIHLPYDKDIEHDRHVARGHAVHAWLQHLHARTPQRPCTVADAPANRTDWRVDDWHLTGDDAELGARLIARHAAVCPLRHADPGTTAIAEQLLTFHDPQADVVLVAKPDLLYHSGGSVVWREIKSTKYRTPRGGKDILEQYPQAALALVLLAEGVLGGDARRSRVEVEILRPSGPDLELVSPRQADRVATARQVIHDLAAPWHRDRTSAPNPGRRCARCEVARWCPATAARPASSPSSELQ
ncbi:PD-(D/E)XK nuclease family protein [Streptomyces sp. NPDC059169]|uniref:PD-(D/E)XK nuclease family protein n=1 Tax=Streptomyces sp. NPDC059169 TaxID=3346754 RepID=UPI0036AEE2FF